MKTRGFKTSLPGACEVTLRRQAPDCEIDLHWLFSPPYFLPFDEAGAARRSIVVRAGGLAVRTLCPEDLLLYLCIHGARVCWPLRLVFDLAGLVSNCRPDWDEVPGQAERAHCMRAVRVGMNLVGRFFGQEGLPPRDWRERDGAATAIAERMYANMVQNTAPFSGAPGGAWSHLRTIETGRGKLRYLWRRAVEPNHLDVEFVDLPDRLSALYYAIRPFRVAGVALKRMHLRG